MIKQAALPAMVGATLIFGVLAMAPARQPSLPILEPGSEMLTFGHLVAGVDSVTYFTKRRADSVERAWAVGMRTISRVVRDGVPLLLLVRSATYGSTRFVDSAYVRQVDLRPVSEVMRLGTNETRFTYDGRTVRRQVVSPDSAAGTVERSYDHRVFHFNELDELITSLPFRVGFTALLPLYSEGTDVLEIDTVRVMQREPSGVWQIRFADPAIWKVVRIDERTRTILSEEGASRQNGAPMRTEHTWQAKTAHTP